MMPGAHTPLGLEQGVSSGAGGGEGMLPPWQPWWGVLGGTGTAGGGSS